MSIPVQPRGEEVTLDPNLDSRPLDESFFFQPPRLTESGIHSELDRLVASTDRLLEELEPGASFKDDHNDFFQVSRAQRLAPGYAVGFTGTKRPDLTGATGLHVVSGSIEVTSKSLRAPYDKVHRVLKAGDRCILRGDESHVVTSPDGAQVLQVVTPRLHRGRSFLLPVVANGEVIAERFRRTSRYRARLALAARGVESRARATGSWLGRSLDRAVPSLRRQQPRRIMFVHAHPDDESSKGAATMAELVAQGHEVMVVTCTGGEQGSVLNPDLEHLSPDEIGSLRKGEMDAALDHLKVQHRWLGYSDSGMPADNVATPGTFAAQTEAAAKDLTKVIREFRPDVVVTYNENGGYPHLDHVATHDVSMAAIEAAADEGQPELGVPHSVSKVYYHVFLDKESSEAIHNRLLADGRESPFDRPPLYPPRRVTTKVRARRRSVIAAERALSSHRSQVNGHSPYWSLPRRKRRVEKFERVRPEPASDDRIESSLLDGLPRSRAWRLTQKRGDRNGRVGRT